MFRLERPGVFFDAVMPNRPISSKTCTLPKINTAQEAFPKRMLIFQPQCFVLPMLVSVRVSPKRKKRYLIPYHEILDWSCIIVLSSCHEITSSQPMTQTQPQRKTPWLFHCFNSWRWKSLGVLLLPLSQVGCFFQKNQSLSRFQPNKFPRKGTNPFPTTNIPFNKKDPITTTFAMIWIYFVRSENSGSKLFDLFPFIAEVIICSNKSMQIPKTITKLHTICFDLQKKWGNLTIPGHTTGYTQAAKKNHGDLVPVSNSTLDSTKSHSASPKAGKQNPTSSSGKLFERGGKVKCNGSHGGHCGIYWDTTGEQQRKIITSRWHNVFVQKKDLFLLTNLTEFHSSFLRSWIPTITSGPRENNNSSSHCPKKMYLQHLVHPIILARNTTWQPFKTHSFPACKVEWL